MAKMKQLRKTLRAIPDLEVPPKVLEEDDFPPEVTLTSESGVTMHFRFVVVTPEVARRWLEKADPNQRAVAWGRVQAIANDIRNGAWKTIHQAVAFDAQGYLIDGQHRLQAIVMANQPAEMLVIRNDAGSYHDPLDRGGARSIAAILNVNARDVAACNMLRQLEQGYQGGGQNTLADVQVLYGRYQDLFQKMSAEVKCRGKLLGPINAAIMWALPVEPQKAVEFASKVATGEMIQRGDPAFALRSWLERNKRVGSWEVAMATFNCLRYFIHDARLANVYTGQVGYRAFCGRRRHFKVPNTPDVDLVPSYNWTVSRGEAAE